MTTTNTAVPPARSSGKRRISAIVISVLLAGIAVLILYVPDYVSAGHFDAERMNRIVEAVRRQRVGEKEVFFRIEDISKSESLSPIQEPLRAAPNVWAQRRNGALQVAIMTRDRGHLGEYGFVFSEVPVTVSDKVGNQTYYDIPGPMMDLDSKIDDHWWEAANRER